MQSILTDDECNNIVIEVCDELRDDVRDETGWNIAREIEKAVLVKLGLYTYPESMFTEGAETNISVVGLTPKGTGVVSVNF